MTDTPPVDRIDTVSEHVSARVPLARPEQLVSDVLDAMRGVRFDSVAAVAVLADDRLVGVASMEQMIGAPVAATVADVMDAAPTVVAPDTDQEHAAWQAVQHSDATVAVVDDAGRFRGLIPPRRLLDVLLTEHDEDLARLGGFLASVESARRTSFESVTRRLWHRMPWLVVGLVGATLSAVLMSAFEAQLSTSVAIAYFVPGIVYLADAVGTQTETLAIRGLSVGVGIRRVIVPESMTGLLVGVLLGGMTLPLVVLLTGDWMLAIAVAITLLAASTIATVVALALPWLLHRLGMDPAFGSGPLATVVQDLLSLAIYLGAVTVLLT
ncbi:magnesium transporter [Mycolicibacterium sp. CAU 1645]|uniref:Magnesium transporter n=1 Tax=Mycolicibacterium arenosum TaxID=2952157 RepID=A0ABT1LVS4_9MYCO|nr:magnesium transporter [Mycolicibacterium sp. CAU 1645]MCP9270998.1 magnesium transporter [Mycolicibacterium sp. CAU 1645]